MDLFLLSFSFFGTVQGARCGSVLTVYAERIAREKSIRGYCSFMSIVHVSNRFVFSVKFFFKNLIERTQKGT